MKYKSGYVYEGAFQDNVRHGHGYFFSDVLVYEVKCRNGYRVADTRKRIKGRRRRSLASHTGLFTLTILATATLFLLACSLAYRHLSKPQLEAERDSITIDL